jgi:hypothetical protein
VVLDTAGAIEVLTLDRDDGMAFIKGVHRDHWCAGWERWLFACLLVADALRTVSEERRAATLAGFLGLARPPGQGDYSGP